MKSKRTIRGAICETERPDWSALEDLIRDVVLAPFMWMFEIELEDGARMDAYKHQMSRRYLYVTEDGRAFGYVSEGRYREIDPLEALATACGEWGPWWPGGGERPGPRAVADEEGKEDGP